MTRDLNVHVGGSFDDIAARVAGAWHRAKAGDTVGEDHLTFENWDALTKVMTAKRLELLRHLHAHPQKSVAALARSLQRDYRRVHEDVAILMNSGLIEQDETGLHAGYDEIRTVIAL